MSLAPTGQPAPPFVSAAEAVASIESGQRVFVHGASATPHLLLEALAAPGRQP